jgi:hypothetical protein
MASLRTIASGLEKGKEKLEKGKMLLACVPFPLQLPFRTYQRKRAELTANDWENQDDRGRCVEERLAGHDGLGRSALRSLGG